MDRILDLQAIDTRIDRLMARKAELEGGEELAAARRAMEIAESTLGEIRLAVDSVASEQRRLEQQIDSMAQKTEAEERRLYDGSIVNVRELEALQAEIAGLKARIARTEDDLLDRMERREELERRASSAAAECETARARVEEVGGEAVRELETIERDLSAKTDERSALASEMDEELLELYDDLRRQKRGVGAAAIVDGVCQGCHEKLSAMELDRLKKVDGVRRCEYCRRIVVFA